MPQSRFAAAGRALAEGLLTVFRLPRLILVAYAMSIVVVAPLALMLARGLQSRIVSTPLANPDAQRFPLTAWEGIAEQASGVVATFTPSILGLAAPLTTLGNIADAVPPSPVVAAAVVAYAVTWIAIWGGLLDVYARGWRGWPAFLAVCRQSAVPLARLALIAMAMHALLFLVVHPALFAVTRSLSYAGGEPLALVLGAVSYLIIGLLLAGSSLVIDYARVDLVVGARSGAIAAVAASWDFIRTHVGAVLLLAVGSAVVTAMAFVGYAVFEVQSRSAPRAWPAIAVGQAYILARIAARLVTAAAQVRLMQIAGRLRAGPV